MKWERARKVFSPLFKSFICRILTRHQIKEIRGQALLKIRRRGKKNLVECIKKMRSRVGNLLTVPINDQITRTIHQKDLDIIPLVPQVLLPVGHFQKVAENRLKRGKNLENNSNVRARLRLLP